EQEGTRQWRAARGLPAERLSQSRQRDQFTQLVLDTRERLKRLYSQALSAEQLREGKAAEFESLRKNYRTLRDTQWSGDKRYDAWINAPLNNAKLLPVGLYDQWVPAFAALFKQVDGDWAGFYAAVERLGKLPMAERKTALRGLSRSD